MSLLEGCQGHPLYDGKLLHVVEQNVHTNFELSTCILVTAETITITFM